MIRNLLFRRLYLPLLVGGLIIVVVAACGTEEPIGYPIKLSTSLINEGRTVYQSNCASCHGDATNPPPLPGAPRHTADGHTWHHTDTQLVGWILNGVPNGQTMPKFNGILSEADAQAAVAYIKTFWPNEIIQQQTQGTH